MKRKDLELEEIMDDLDMAEFYYKKAKGPRAKQAYYKLWYLCLVKLHRLKFRGYE